MTNLLVGDVYAKIIEDVVAASTNDFEESGVSQTTLQELQQEWQQKLSSRAVAQMPWDPKPAPPPPAQSTASSAPTPVPATAPPANNGYYDNQTNGMNGAARVKSEGGPDGQYHAGSNGYPTTQSQPPPQGGYARAQQLVQQYSGQTASTPASNMQQQQQQQQQQRVGLALPGQQARPQGLNLPGAPTQSAMSQRHPQAGEIKLESDSPVMSQGSFQQPTTQSTPSYSQTDGADDALDDWKAMMTQRRALADQQREQADHHFKRMVLQHQAELESGLMMPLKERASSQATRTTHQPADGVPQLDGDVDEDDKLDVKDDDDENAINSDLDDTDDEAQNQMGDDDDDNGDSILCTYDKVQRVKNKWKCTLKDGVMSVGGKEYVFHKGTGEFEW